MKKVDTGKPKRRAEFSLVRAKTASKKEKEKAGKENQSRDVLQIIRTKEERLNSAFSRDGRSTLSSITNNRLTHKLGLYGKAKHSDIIHREGKTTEHVQLQQDGSTDTSSEAFEEERNMECSPTFVNNQDAQCTAEHIALVLLPENTFGTADYLYQLRCHLQRIMKQNEVECSDEQEDDNQQTVTQMEHDVIAVTISQSVPTTNVITTTHRDDHNLSLPTHHHHHHDHYIRPHCSKDMLSESGDTGGWISHCSHDPIQLVTIRSPTPTHSLPFEVGLELTIPPAPPPTTKNDILDLLDSIPSVVNPLGVSPSPPKLLPHRLY